MCNIIYYNSTLICYIELIFMFSKKIMFMLTRANGKPKIGDKESSKYSIQHSTSNSQT